MALTNDQITAQNFKDFYGQIRPYLNGAAHAGFTPIGTVISVMGNHAPLNYLICNGQIVNIADYPELASYFNQEFGSINKFGGDGTTTFAVPDLRGEFLRGTGTNGHTNQGNGADVGNHQDSTESPIMGVYNTDGTVGSGSRLDVKFNTAANISSSTTKYDTKVKKSITSKYITINSSSIYSPSSTDNDNYSYTLRPTNTSVLFCIATKNIFMDAGHNYSTDEQVVGTWINGKPVYQKTIDFGYLPNNTVKTVAHNISNLDWVVDAKGTAYNGSGGYRSIPILYNTTYASYNTAFIVRLADIQLEVNNDMSAFYAYITIQYTKTTD